MIRLVVHTLPFVDGTVGSPFVVALLWMFQSLRKVAERFDPLQYKELLQAYITLAEHSENLGFEFSSYSLSEVLSNIPEIVVRCIDDITRQYLSQRFDQKSPKKPKGKKKAHQRRGHKEHTRSELSPAAKTIEDVTHGFERLTDLMHTYYLLVQWHRDPFNPKNDTLEYLHRCGIDDDDDDDDEDDYNEENEHHHNESIPASGEKTMSGKLKKLLSPRAKRSSSISSENSATTQRSPYSHILCETGMTLLRYRKIVWENMQQNVMEVLDRLDMTYGEWCLLPACALYALTARCDWCCFYMDRLQDGAHHRTFPRDEHIHRDWRGVHGSSDNKVRSGLCPCMQRHLMHGDSPRLSLLQAAIVHPDQMRAVSECLP